MYEQRSPEPAATSRSDRRHWRPDDEPLRAVEAIADGDRYVAVDRIDARVVTLAVAPWPTVEPETGRLDFGPPQERRTVTVSLTNLQTRVDLDRRANDQLVRVIRPGDVFLVRGFESAPARWSWVVDVTRSGRLAAKAALFSTAAPAPHPAELRDYGLDRRLAADGEPTGATPAPPEEPDETPPGPVAYPAV